MLAEMQRQSQRMTQLVEDLLALSRLEARETAAGRSRGDGAMLSTLRREGGALSQASARITVGDEAGVDLWAPTRNCTARSPTVANAVRYPGRRRIRCVSLSTPAAA